MVEQSIVYVKNKKLVERVMASITRFIEEKLMYDIIVYMIMLSKLPETIDLIIK